MEMLYCFMVLQKIDICKWTVDIFVYLSPIINNDRKTFRYFYLFVLGEVLAG